MSNRAQRQSELVKKGEGQDHETAVFRLFVLACSVGYDGKKDHTINERILETSSFFDPNCVVNTQFYRLDLVLERNGVYIINEVDGARHETKIIQGKDRVKSEDVCIMLRKYDPIFIRWKIDGLIGKYKNTDDQIKDILNSPKRFHMQVIA